MTQAEAVEVDKIRAPLPTELASPMFVSTPVLETRPVVEYVQDPTAEYVAHARAITCALQHPCLHTELALPVAYTAQEASDRV